MPKDDQPPPDESPPAPKKRKWRRRLLITGVVLLVLGGLANGPGARWLIHRTITGQLAKLGLEGDLTVEGRITSGFTLENGSFTGQATAAEITFDSLSIDYRILELLDKKVRRIEGRDITVVLVAGEKEPPPGDEEGITLPDLEAVGEKLRAYRELARPITIDFENIRFTQVRPDRENLTFQLESLTHPADSDVFRLTGLQSNALGEDGLPKQDLLLRWEREDLVLNELTILPDLKLGVTRVDYTAGSPVGLFAELTARSSRLITYVDATGTIEVDLANSDLDLESTLDGLLPDLPLDGQITRLRLRADHLLGPVREWTLEADLTTENLRWKEQVVGALNTTIEVGEHAVLTVEKTDGLAATVRTGNPLRREGEFDAETWWKNTEGTASFEIPSVHELLKTAFALIDRPLPNLATNPDGLATIDAAFITSGPMQIEVPKASWSLSDATFGGNPLPDLKGSASLQETTAAGSVALATPGDGETLDVDGSYQIKERSYTGTLLVDLPDPAWLLPLIPGDGEAWKPQGALHLSWSGSGSLENATHGGEAEVHELAIRRPGEADPLNAKLKASYEWPGLVDLSALALRSGDLLLDGSVRWADERLSIPVLRLHDADGPLASLQGGVPLSAEDRSLDEILARPGPLDLNISADQLELARLRSMAPLPDDLNALITTDLQIGGSLQSPTLGGTFSGTSIRLPSPDSLPLLAAELEFSTTAGQLTVTGKVEEPGGRLLSLDGSVPLDVDAWRDDPAALRDLPLDVTARVDQLALGRLQIVAPMLAKAEGVLDATFQLTGTPQEPLFGGGGTLSVQRFPLGDTPYRNIRDVTIRLKLDGRKIIVEPSSGLIAGGRLDLSGSVDLSDKEPQLDLRLGADHALLWRNDSFILRSNGDLRLAGPWKTARLSGSLSLVECLYYKDIEIIPIGVPTTSAPKPRLPKFEAKPSGQTFTVPEPFADWTLDVTVTTGDPILIRGNVATGRITANTKIQGTFANPRPSGRFLIEKATADLPFSTLEIKDGTLTLRPEAPLNPFIDIRGTSNVNSNRVTLNLYGSLNDPKYILASDRGLPQNEILTLLATGSTAADLEDPELAKSKAFQLFLDDLRRRANKPGGNELFRSVLNELDDVNLKVGENDPFSGRKFNSATLQVADQWYLSAAVDGQGNTRGLVIFSMRFK